MGDLVNIASTSSVMPATGKEITCLPHQNTAPFTKWMWDATALPRAASKAELLVCLRTTLSNVLFIFYLFIYLFSRSVVL